MDTEQARMTSERGEEYAREMYQGAMESTDEMRRSLMRTMRERPYVAGGIALLSGLLIGGLVAARRRSIMMEERRPLNRARRLATNSLGNVMTYLADAIEVGAEYFSNRMRSMAP